MPGGYTRGRALPRVLPSAAACGRHRHSAHGRYAADFPALTANLFFAFPPDYEQRVARLLGWQYAFKVEVGVAESRELSDCLSGP
jgi:hypothetical protein